jgi:hypothetical protein
MGRLAGPLMSGENCTWQNASGLLRLRPGGIPDIRRGRWSGRPINVTLKEYSPGTGAIMHIARAVLTAAHALQLAPPAAGLSFGKLLAMCLPVHLNCIGARQIYETQASF